MGPGEGRHDHSNGVPASGSGDTVIVRSRIDSEIVVISLGRSGDGTHVAPGVSLVN